MDFLLIFSILHAHVAILGMIFNATVIYLALYQTPKVIRSYSFLIINFALTDFFACFFELFVQQRHIPVGVTLGYVSNGFCKHFGHTACFVGYSLMMHFISHSLWSLLLSFAYRYYILCRPAPSRLKLSIIIFLVYIPSLIQMISFIFSQDDPKEIEKILHDNFPQYNFSGKIVTGTKNMFCFSAMFTVLHMTVPVTPVFICILILRRKIIQELSYQGVNMKKSLHTQILMALTYQAIIPGFYLFSVIAYLICQFVVSHPIFEFTTLTSVLFIPFLSPLASIIFVTPYHHYIRRKLCRITNFKRRYMSSTTSYQYADVLLRTEASKTVGAGVEL